MYQYRDSGSSSFWVRSSIEQELIDYQQQIYGGRPRFSSPAPAPKPLTHNGQHPIVKRYVVNQ